MVSELADLLAKTVAPQVTSELQKNLRGLFGGIVRGYLPQVWWFTTESDSATLYVDQEGVCQIYDGRSRDPDVHISWTDRAFRVALTTRDRLQLPQGTPSPQVQTYSGKGQTAFKFLRKRLGL